MPFAASLAPSWAARCRASSAKACPTRSIIASPLSTYALQFARDMDPVLADKFVGMYVNKWTLDYGDEGRRAVRELCSAAPPPVCCPRACPSNF